MSALLARNNFEMTSIVQRNAYETSYYAFRYGTLRSLREFFEGIVYPVSTIIGTLTHYWDSILSSWSLTLMYVVPFVLLSLSLGYGAFCASASKAIYPYDHSKSVLLYSYCSISCYRNYFAKRS